MPLNASELRDLKAKKAESVQTLISSIAAEERAATDDEQAQIDDGLRLCEGWEKQAQALDSLETLKAQGGDGASLTDGAAASAPLPVDPETDALQNAATPKIRFKLASPLKAFKERQDAYDSGQWLLAVLKQDQKASEYCVSRGFDIKATQTGGTNTAGGFTVPDPLSQAIIDVRTEVGIARRWSRVIPMTSDTLKVPKRSTGPAVQYPGEGAAITETNKVWAQVSLAVVKRALLSKISTELTQDSVIGIVDDMAREFGYQFAEQEDNELINGDGTATYGSETGLLSAVGTAGVHDIGSGDTTWDDIVIGDFHTLVGLLPSRFHPGASWLMSRAFHANVVEKLIVALGGTTMLMAESGAVGRSFLGYPILFTDQLPTATAVDSKCCVFGSGMDSVIIGDRTGVDMASSEGFAFNEDVITLRGTTRYDINVHEGGDASNAGGYVVLETAAS